MAKKKQSKNTVFCIEEQNGESCGVVFPDLSGVLAWIEGDMDGAKEGDSFDYIITVKKMTLRQYNKLEEYEG